MMRVPFGLFAAALCAFASGCAEPPVYKQPSMVAQTVLDTDGPVTAAAVARNLDGKPAFARLYIISAEHADEAIADIQADDGRLGRWAMIVRASQPMDGRSRETIALEASRHCCRAGDLAILAVDPLSPGRFTFSKARIGTVGGAPQ
jgi:hypothetical protein